ncbi:hypothetical protein C8Q79DRAFT_1008284 [Trametes meyenii]|nr:hypothetical protein C8Q79DRAFT_1008284 [Trametes meyenii]
MPKAQKSAGGVALKTNYKMSIEERRRQKIKEFKARRPRRSSKDIERELEEQRKAREERRAKAGIPGPVDRWLSGKLAQGVRADIDSPLAADEVQCEVCIERIPVRYTFRTRRLTLPPPFTGPDWLTWERPQHPDPDDFFMDYDTLVLRLTVTSPARGLGEGALQSETRVVLGTYDNDPEWWEAPDWVQHPVGIVAVFRDTAAAISDLIQRVAPSSDGMTGSIQTLIPARVPRGDHPRVSTLGSCGRARDCAARRVIGR